MVGGKTRDTGNNLLQYHIVHHKSNVERSLIKPRAARGNENFSGTYKDVVVDACGTFSGSFTKLRKAAVSFVISVSPRGTTRLPMDRFTLSLILESFSKMCPLNSTLIRI